MVSNNTAHFLLHAQVSAATAEVHRESEQSEHPHRISYLTLQEDPGHWSICELVLYCTKAPCCVCSNEPSHKKTHKVRSIFPPSSNFVLLVSSSLWAVSREEEENKEEEEKELFFLKLKMFTIGIFFPRLPVWDIQSFNKTGETEEEK